MKTAWSAEHAELPASKKVLDGNIRKEQKA